MAGNIKGITLEIDGNVQGLDKALKQVNKELKGSQNELKQVEKALKLDPKNTELLTQKQKLLNDVFEQNKSKLKSLKDAKKQADEAMKNGTEVNEQEYRRLQREISLTASEIKKMGNAVKQEGLEQIGNGAKNIAKGLAVATTAIVGIGTAAYATADKIADVGDAIDKGSQKIGISAEGYQRWEQVLQHSGTSIDGVKKGFATLDKQISKNSESFKKIGVNIEGMSKEQVFEATVKGLQNISNQTERTALATELFGSKAAMEMGALLNTTNEATDAMLNQANVMSNENVKASAEFKDVQQDLVNQVTTLGQSLLSDLMPTIVEIMKSLQDWVANNKDQIKEIVENIANFIKTLVENGNLVIGLITTIGTAFLTWNVVSMITGVITTIKGLTMATEAQSTAQALLNVIMSANPIGIIITAVAALTAGFIYLWNNCEGFRNFFINMWEKIKEVALACAEAIKTAWNTVVDSISNFISKLKGTVQKIVDVGLNFVKGLWQGISDGTQWLLNKIKEWCGSILNGVKSFFGIKSPSKVFREQVGRMLPKGMALGIQDGQTEVEKALNELNGSVISIEQGFADEQKKIYDAMSKDFSSYVDNVANKFDELGEAQKNWTSKLRDGISLTNEYTYQKTDGGGYRYSKGGVTVKGTKLADLSQSITDTKNWNAKVQSLKALLPAEMFSEIASGNVQDITSFMSAFFSASASEQQKFINDWEELQKVTNEASKAIYSEEVQQTRDEFISAFSQTPQEFFGIGEEAATQFGSAFMDKLSEVLKGMKISVNKTANSILPSEQRQIVINQNISGYAQSPYEVAKETSLMFKRLEKGLAM